MPTLDELVDSTYVHLGLRTLAAKEFLRLALGDLLLFDEKQSDYGSANIERHGVYGIVVRLADKVERLKNLELRTLSKEEQLKVKDAMDTLRYLKKNEHRLSTFEAIEQLDQSVALLEKLFARKRRKAFNESMLDTFADISNYAIIARMVEKGKWPKE